MKVGEASQHVASEQAQTIYGVQVLRIGYFTGDDTSLLISRVNT